MKISQTPGVGQQAHRMDARVPAVEVADDADTRGVGRPHREVHAVGGAVAEQPGAEGLVGALVGAFAPQMAVELAEDGAVAIRIVDHERCAVWPVTRSR